MIEEPTEPEENDEPADKSADMPPCKTIEENYRQSTSATAKIADAKNHKRNLFWEDVAFYSAVFCMIAVVVGFVIVLLTL